VAVAAATSKVRVINLPSRKWRCLFACSQDARAIQCGDTRKERIASRPAFERRLFRGRVQPLARVGRARAIGTISKSLLFQRGLAAGMNLGDGREGLERRAVHAASTIQSGQIRLRMWHARNKRVALSDRRPGAISKNQDRNDKARREPGFASC